MGRSTRPCRFRIGVLARLHHALINRRRVLQISTRVLVGSLWYPDDISNLLLAESNIVKNPQRLNAARIIDRQSPAKSPLFEQAPYSVNAWLNYANPRTGSDVTVTFNEVGERLIRVNTDGTPDLYSQPTPVLDLVFSQKINKRLLFKGYAKNILNQSFKEVYANPGNGGKYYGKEYISRDYRKGAEFMLGLTYNLF